MKHLSVDVKLLLALEEAGETPEMSSERECLCNVSWQSRQENLHTVYGRMILEVQPEKNHRKALDRHFIWTLPFRSPVSDKTPLSSWPGRRAENLVYGPSTEHSSILIDNDSRDSRRLLQPLCWYQESCRHRATAKAGVPCLADAGGNRGSVYFSPTVVLLEDKAFFVCLFSGCWCVDLVKSRKWDTLESQCAKKGNYWRGAYFSFFFPPLLASKWLF